MRRICLFMAGLFFSVPGSAADLTAVCDSFCRDLACVPHRELTVEQDVVMTTPDGKAFHGCKVVFRSHAALTGDHYRLPSFWPHEGTPLYQQGWRLDHRYTADGPGSGKHGIVNNSLLCIIDWDRHSWIDEQTNEIVQSDLINMQVNCLDKRHPYDQ